MAGAEHAPAPLLKSQKLGLRVVDQSGATYEVRIAATASTHELLIAVGAAGCTIPRHLGIIVRGPVVLERYETLAAYAVRDGDALHILERRPEEALCALADDADKAFERHRAQLASLQQFVDAVQTEMSAAHAAAILVRARESARLQLINDKCQRVVATMRQPGDASAAERGCQEMLAEAELSAEHRAALVRAGAIKILEHALDVHAGHAPTITAGVQVATRLASDTAVHEQMVQANVLTRAYGCISWHEGNAAVQVGIMRFAQAMAGSSSGRAALQAIRFADAIQRARQTHHADPTVQEAAAAALRHMP